MTKITEIKKELTLGELLTAIIKSVKSNWSQFKFRDDYFTHVSDANFRKWKNDIHFPSSATLSRVDCIEILQNAVGDFYEKEEKLIFRDLIMCLENQGCETASLTAGMNLDSIEDLNEFIKKAVTVIYRTHERKVLNSAVSVANIKEKTAYDTEAKDAETEKINDAEAELQKQIMDEDSLKLTQDYDMLTFIYDDKCLLHFENEMPFEDGGEKEFIFPVMCDFDIYGKDVKITDNPEGIYNLPEFVQVHYDELLAAHSNAKIYDQMNIRVDDWHCDKSTFEMNTSRTTYFNSLVTNRVMDFTLTNGRTVRNELYRGPFPQSLAESKLSDHLGFNGFVSSTDDFIPFVHRKMDMSVEKNMYGNSVQASLKTRYALNDGLSVFKPEGIKNAIVNEIRDELKISPDNVSELSLLYAYRNLIEGGKPQLLFYTETDITKDEIQSEFNRKRQQRRENMMTDTADDMEEFVWIPVSDFINGRVFVHPEKIIHNEKVYPMAPSATAAVAMFIMWLRQHSDKKNQ